ncbi:MAG: hypothetical protein R6X35_07345 [Candidatus Krumholzibacteriia bacterium]
MKTMTLRTLATLAAFALLGLAAGCESDSVAPQDTLPPISAEDAAYQSGLIAAAISQISPEIMNPTLPGKQVVNVTWGGQFGLTGTVRIDYRNGPDGDPATSTAATWARLFTDEDAPVVFTVPDLGGQTRFDLEVTATLDQLADQATILSGSGGTMTSGEYVVTFVLAGIVVGGSGYPEQGSMTVTAGTHTAAVTFNGTNTATMIVDSSVTYSIDLDTGEVTTGAPF